MRKIAVTGATGFIGRHVVEVLKSTPDVAVVAVGRNKERLESLGTQYAIVDLEKHIGESFSRMDRSDILIHMAWERLPQYCDLYHFEFELPRQYNFLKGLIREGLSSLVVAGTCFEYGFQYGQLSERAPTHPCTPYGYAKDALRQQVQYLRNMKHFRFTWARTFYLHGKGQSKTSLWSQLNDTATRGGKEFKMSGGEQLRDYLHVNEVARKLVALALLNSDMEIVNICSGKPISIRNLVEGWIESHRWDIRLKLGCYPYPDYEPMAFWGDRQKLDNLLSTIGYAIDVK